MPDSSMTISLLLATLFIDAACDLCGKPKRVYPDPETGGRICLDCLEMLCEPLPELPPDPEICAMGREIVAARRNATSLNANSLTDTKGN